MTPIIILAILSAIFTLFIIAPIADTHKKTCYILMILIPAFALISYIAVFPPTSLISKDSNDKINIAKLKNKLKYNKGDNNTISELAAIYIANDRLDEAIILLENSKQSDKLQLATAYFAKGLLYAEQGQKEQALKFLQKAQKTAPKNAYFLGDIQIFIDKVKGNITYLNNSE